MGKLHIAQINIGRVRGELDGPVMQGFVARLNDLNALADASPGFVWRLQTEEGNATYLRPFEDERVLLNMSVWETLDDLRNYVYRTGHAEMLRKRREWFEEFEAPFLALWWVPAGHIPSIDEARKRLDHLQRNGPTAFAFTFRTLFPPDEEFAASTDWSAFEPCPSTA
jgi:uncharacterized protein DUF3291